MGFDIVGMNPKNIEINEPERPENLFELSQKEQDKYFEKRELYLNQSGTYFRNNVWWWRPLAEYVLNYTKVIPEHEQESWQYNDCTEVSKQNAEMIAQQLDHLIKVGHTKQFEKDYEKTRKKIEKHNEKVEKELETFSQSVRKKMRNDNLAPKDFPEEDHKKWEEIYNKRNSSGSYPFSEENVKEFSEFCKNCGGFTIG